MSNSSISFFDGLVAGSLGAFGVYPIDVVKTRMQNQTNSNRIYQNGFDCWRKLYQTGGFRAFYRGCLVQTTMVGPEKAIKLFTYSLVTKNNKDEFKYHLVGGLAAGTAQVTITSPYEMIKTNLQMENKINYRELFHFRKLYTGASACYLRDIPFSGIYFPVYWYLKEKQEFNPFLAGTIAGAPAAFLCTPADVIKTRMQTFRKESKGNPKMVGTARSIYQKEGWQAFFKGGGWRVLRSSPQFGITLLSFELLEKQFNQMENTNQQTNHS